jgi:hypothetical protein
MSDGQQIAKVGAVSAPVVVGATLLVAQIFAMSIISDLVMSVMVFGAGYLTCYLKNKRAG